MLKLRKQVNMHILARRVRSAEWNEKQLKDGYAYSAERWSRKVPVCERGLHELLGHTEVLEAVVERRTRQLDLQLVEQLGIVRVPAQHKAESHTTRRTILLARRCAGNESLPGRRCCSRDSN